MQSPYTEMGIQYIPIFVRLIITWHCEQHACVRWGSTLSPKFNVSNGVRQGGIPSPIFFNLYTDTLSVTLSKTKVGCALGKIMVNHLAYADDLVILSPSAKGLQKLLNICSEYGEEHDIMFNHKKTECMYFPVKGFLKFTQGFLKFAPFAMGH